MAENTKAGLEALLRSPDGILVLTDHQPSHFTNLNSYQPRIGRDNVVGLAKTSQVFNLNTTPAAVVGEGSGYLIKRHQGISATGITAHIKSRNLN